MTSSCVVCFGILALSIKLYLVGRGSRVPRTQGGLKFGYIIESCVQQRRSTHVLATLHVLGTLRALHALVTLNVWASCTQHTSVTLRVLSVLNALRALNAYRTLVKKYDWHNSTGNHCRNEQLDGSQISRWIPNQIQWGIISNTHSSRDFSIPA